MKKFLLGAAVVCLALTSCVKDEPKAQLVRRAVTFDAPVMYGNEATRATVYGEIGQLTEKGNTYP